MSGLEKILEQINKEATDTANETINFANKEAEKILKKAEEDAEAKRTGYFINSSDSLYPNSAMKKSSPNLR